MSRPITRPLLQYFGGKFRLAPWIVAQFPDHRTYVEPFGGAASVLFAKPPAEIEVYNDLDDALVNLMTVLREPADAAELGRRLDLTPYARREFERAYEPTDDRIEWARHTVIRGQMAFASVGVLKRSGFRARGKEPRSWSVWKEQLPAIIDRLSTVLIERRPAVDVMRRFDHPDTLHYVDPPYPLASRSDSARVYRHEMEDRDHVALVDVLLDLKGNVIVSGYSHPLYDERLVDWRRLEHPARNGANGEAIECLWIKG